MTLKFNFDYKGFNIDMAVTHAGDSVKIEASITHPEMPSVEEIYTLIMSSIPKASNK